MAKSNTENTTTEAAATQEATRKNHESVYSAEELANAARGRFGVPPEVVIAALKMAGKTGATLAEANEIVKAFMERTV